MIWRAKGDLDRAIADTTEAIRLAKAKAPVNIMTPPGSVLISAYTHRALAYEAKGDFDRAKQDYAAALARQGLRRRQQGQPGHRKGSPVAVVRDAAARAANGNRSATAASRARPRQLQPAGAASPPPPAAAEMRKRAETDREAVRRVALVIGNGAYAHVRPLPNPTNDARAMAKSLRDIGFVVTEGTDLDRTAMQATIRDFLRDAARSQVAVVYYAGHGVQIDGRNYLVPIDIEFRAGSGMTDAMMDLDTIMAGLDDQVRTNILILDACRNNPMAPKLASTGPARDIEAGSGLAAPDDARRRLDLGCGHADRICDRARTGRARRRRRQQPVLGGADAPYRHAGAGSAADADAGPRRGGRGDQGQAGAVVELVAARRGLSGGEVTRSLAVIAMRSEAIHLARG